MNLKKWTMLFIIVLFSMSGWALETSELADSKPSESPLQYLPAAENLTGARPWVNPNYNYEDAQVLPLGHSNEAFAVPEGMQERVNFWINIYANYTSDQGVLHDSENPHIVYKSLDFSFIESRTDIGPIGKEKEREKMVDAARAEVERKLEDWSQLTDSSSLDEASQKIWKQIQAIKDDDKFAKRRIRFQQGMRDHMMVAQFRSGRYRERFEEIFTEQGLPKELVRLIYVESSFNVFARSRVGASGLWQLMPFIEKRKLQPHSTIDLRNDPYSATAAAARLLKQNYNRLQSWPLAVTAYNHGAGGVSQIVNRYGTRELGELIENVESRRSFGFASRNFYASFLAALHVESQAPKYFGTQWFAKPFDKGKIKIPSDVKWSTVVMWFGGDERLAQTMNPHVTSEARSKNRSIPARTELFVVPEKVAEIMDSFKTNKVANECPLRKRQSLILID